MDGKNITDVHTGGRDACPAFGMATSYHSQTGVNGTKWMNITDPEKHNDMYKLSIQEMTVLTKVCMCCPTKEEKKDDAKK